MVESVDQYRNPHSYTKNALSRATGENQYALGRVLGLEVSGHSHAVRAGERLWLYPSTKAVLMAELQAAITCCAGGSTSSCPAAAKEACAYLSGGDIRCRAGARDYRKARDGTTTITVNTRTAHHDIQIAIVQYHIHMHRLRLSQQRVTTKQP